MNDSREGLLPIVATRWRRRRIALARRGGSRVLPVCDGPEAAQPQRVVEIDVGRLLRLGLVVFCVETAFVAGWWTGSRVVVPSRAAPAGQGESDYTCPLHPAIRSAGPGECPFDGHPLEPVGDTKPGTPSLDQADGDSPWRNARRAPALRLRSRQQARAA